MRLILAAVLEKGVEDFSFQRDETGTSAISSRWKQTDTVKEEFDCLNYRPNKND